MTCSLNVVMYNAPRMEELNARDKQTEPFFGFALRDLNGDKFGEVFPWKKDTSERVHLRCQGHHLG